MSDVCSFDLHFTRLPTLHRSRGRAAGGADTRRRRRGDGGAPRRSSAEWRSGRRTRSTTAQDAGRRTWARSNPSATPGRWRSSRRPATRAYRFSPSAGGFSWSTWPSAERCASTSNSTRVRVTRSGTLTDASATHAVTSSREPSPPSSTPREMGVNSLHHQVVDEVGEGLIVTGEGDRRRDRGLRNAATVRSWPCSGTPSYSRSRTLVPVGRSRGARERLVQN